MVQRELYMNKIEEFIDVDLIKVITGIRRLGKSYFLNLIIDNLALLQSYFFNNIVLLLILL